MRMRLIANTHTNKKRMKQQQDDQFDAHKRVYLVKTSMYRHSHIPSH